MSNFADLPNIELLALLMLGVPLPDLNRITRAGSRPFLSRSGRCVTWGNAEAAQFFSSRFFTGFLPLSRDSGGGGDCRETAPTPNKRKVL